MSTRRSSNVEPKKAARKKNHKRKSLRRHLRSERLETRQLLAANIFHNEMMPEDVNEDGEVSARDALTIINQLGRQGRGDADADGARGRGRMTDVNNDGVDSPIDALMVINRLSRGQRGGGNDAPETPRDPDGPDADTPNEDVGSEDATTQQRTDAVLAWNNLFNELLVADETNQNPGYASRAMAMLNLAIYDAVTLTNGDPADTFYDYEDLGPTSQLRAEIAASQAAYTVLSSLYPNQQAEIDAFRAEVFEGFRPGEGTDASVELGTAIGNGVLEARADDGSDVVGDYTYGDGIGDFQPDPLNPDVPVWGPKWSEVDPFVISSAEDFAPETTPPITSEEYAASYNEVKELGSVDSETRTADQTEAGIFWAYDRVGLGTPMALFNDALEAIAVQEGNTFAENAALYAQASVAMADAGVVAWHTKFDEQFWRPVTAIHQGDDDGNPLTEGDEDWTALGAPDGGDDIIGFTPQFPTYISGHATFGGAVFGAIREFYGTDDISFELSSRELEIIMENPELEEAYGLDLDDAVRSFDSLTEAMAENGRSRVYLGIHFDFDDLVGQEVGQAVATSVASQFVVAEGNRGDGGGLGPDPGGPGNGPGPNPGGPGDGGPDRGPGDRPGDRGPDDRGPRGGRGMMADLNNPLDPIDDGDADDVGTPDLINDADLELLARDQQTRRREGRPERNGSGGQRDDNDGGGPETLLEDTLDSETLV